MNRRLAVHGDNNSANGFFALRLPEICGRKAGRVIEHGGEGGGEGGRRNRSKETKGRAEQKGVEGSTDTNALRMFPSSSNN